MAMDRSAWAILRDGASKSAVADFDTIDS